MLIEEIRSVYDERRMEMLDCKVIKIRADLYSKLLGELYRANDIYTLSEPYKIFGMEVQIVSPYEDYCFMILD